MIGFTLHAGILPCFYKHFFWAIAFLFIYYFYTITSATSLDLTFDTFINPALLQISRIILSLFCSLEHLSCSNQSFSPRHPLFSSPCVTLVLSSPLYPVPPYLEPLFCLSVTHFCRVTISLLCETFCFCSFDPFSSILTLTTHTPPHPPSLLYFVDLLPRYSRHPRIFSK